MQFKHNVSDLTAFALVMLLNKKNEIGKMCKNILIFPYSVYYATQWNHYRYNYLHR